MNVIIKTESEDLFNEQIAIQPNQQQREAMNKLMDREIVGCHLVMNTGQTLDTLINSEFYDSVAIATLIVK